MTTTTVRREYLLLYVFDSMRCLLNANVKRAPPWPNWIQFPISGVPESGFYRLLNEYTSIMAHCATLAQPISHGSFFFRFFSDLIPLSCCVAFVGFGLSMSYTNILFRLILDLLIYHRFQLFRFIPMKIKTDRFFFSIWNQSFTENVYNCNKKVIF